MSAPVSDYVLVQVTTQGAAVQAPGFGVGLVLQTHLRWTDRERSYTAASQLLDDGFAATDPAYLAAQVYFSQSPAPSKLRVGLRHADTATVIVATAVDTTNYTITISGVAYTIGSGSSATTSTIATALRAAVNADSACPVAATGSGANVILTTKVSGTAWSLAITGTRMTLSGPTSAETIGAALDAILLAQTDFYGVAVVGSRLSADMQALATWVSANNRLGFVFSDESGVINTAVGSDTTSLPAILKAAGYDRVLCLYDANGATNWIDVAAMAWVLAHDPGSYSFALKTLIGPAVSNLSPTQRANAKAKRCVTYETVGNSINGTSNGVVPSGKNVDQIHGRDWLSAQIQTLIFQLLASVNKVPFTDDGIGQIEQKAKQAGAFGVARNYLASYTTSFPLLASISSVDKANRVLNGASLTGVESGAIETVVTFNLIVQV